MGLREAKNKLVRKVGLAIVTRQIMKYARQAASGELGVVWQARYEFWKGKKTWTGVALMLAGVAAEALGQHDVAVWAAGAGGLLASIGLVERSYRTEIPSSVAMHPLYRFLAAHGGMVGGVLVTASTLFQGSADCSWCLVADKVVLVLGAAAVQVKLIDPAWRSSPPILDIGVVEKYRREDDAESYEL